MEVLLVQKAGKMFNVFGGGVAVHTFLIVTELNVLLIVLMHWYRI